MSKAIDETEATAYHEAGHVVALAHFGIGTESVTVETHDSGETLPDRLPEKEEDIVLVALAGIESESDHTVGDAMVAFSMWVSGRGDRDAIDRNARGLWIGHGSASVWYEAQYHKAEAFVQKNRAKVSKVALALLKKAGFPKTLDRQEIEALLQG